MLRRGGIGLLTAAAALFLLEIKMDAMEIRVKIKSLEESNNICKVCAKDHMQYLKTEFVDKLLQEQSGIIASAKKKIDEIVNRRSNAVMEIGKLEMQQRYNDRKLIELHNHKQIEEFKKLIEKRKEILNGLANNPT